MGRKHPGRGSVTLRSRGTRPLGHRGFPITSESVTAHYQAGGHNVIQEWFTCCRQRTAQPPRFIPQYLLISDLFHPHNVAVIIKQSKQTEHKRANLKTSLKIRPVKLLSSCCGLQRRKQSGGCKPTKTSHTVLISFPNKADFFCFGCSSCEPLLKHSQKLGLINTFQGVLCRVSSFSFLEGGCSVFLCRNRAAASSSERRTPAPKPNSGRQRCLAVTCMN